MSEESSSDPRYVRCTSVATTLRRIDGMAKHISIHVSTIDGEVPIHQEDIAFLRRLVSYIEEGIQSLEDA